MAHVAVFRAVQADALAAVVVDRHDLLEKLDVGQDLHAVPVDGFGGQVAGTHDGGLVALELGLQVRVAGQLVLVGLQDDAPVEAVEDDDAALGQVVTEALHADHRRNLQGPGQDAGVGGLAALGRGEGHDLVHVQLDGVGRGQVVSQKDCAVRDGVEPARAADELAEHPLGHESDILHALAKVVVRDGGEDLLQIPHGALQSPLGVDPGAFDVIQGAFAELVVAQHHEVRLDDGRMLLEVLGHEAQDPLQILQRGLEGAAQPLHFARHVLLAHGLAGHAGKMVAVQAVGPPDGHARGNRDAVKGAGRHQRSSPNMSSNIFVRLEMAWAASGPWARSRSSVPCGAARDSRSRMDLASASMPPECTLMLAA